MYLKFISFLVVKESILERKAANLEKYSQLSNYSSQVLFALMAEATIQFFSVIGEDAFP